MDVLLRERRDAYPWISRGRGLEMEDWGGVLGGWVANVGQEFVELGKNFLLFFFVAVFVVAFLVTPQFTVTVR
jgi:hypothetical protein